MSIVSVIMPVYNQANYIKFAIGSLLRQSHQQWELLIIDDGSTDNLKGTISEYLLDNRISCYRNEENKGLGYSLNLGLKLSSSDFIAYLPADDVYFENHLETMLAEIVQKEADLVFSGLVYHMGDRGGESAIQQAKGIIPNQTLQLVQVLHRKTANFCLERNEIVTEDLGRKFWNKYIEQHPKISQTKQITCEWSSHSNQRHRIMDDRAGGGIFRYKQFYGVKDLIRYQSTVGNMVDEVSHYEQFRLSSSKNISKSENGLKILLVGELAFNPERILALEERRHKLYGLWIRNPANYNTIGPLPFGNVEDIALEDWDRVIEQIKPDVIYALLNYKAVELSHHILKKRKKIPFVWHFKEGPFYCRTYGLWNKLMDLYEEADGVIFTNPLVKQWFSLYLRKMSHNSMILDGDLPPRYWFGSEKSTKLSQIDGELHTVIAGRLFGIDSETIEKLAQQHIHFHLYGDIYRNAAHRVLDEANALCPGYIHFHQNCPAERWVTELSKYDAGWMHYYESHNNGDLFRANWADLNSPARMATYAVAGLPMIIHDNSGHLVHHQNHLSNLGMDLPIKHLSELGELLADSNFMKLKSMNTWKNRNYFCFETYVDELIKLFESVI